MPTTAAQTISFDEYFERMRPWAARISTARSRGHTHPYLSKEDLLQEAFIALLDVYKRHAGRVPTDDLCRLGTRAVLCDLMAVYNRTGRRGERGWKDPATGERVVPRFISLDGDDGNGRRIQLPEDGRALERVLCRGIVEEIARMDAAGEFDAPSPAAATVSALKRLLETDDAGASRAFKAVQENFPHGSGYTYAGGRNGVPPRKGGNDMGSANGPEAPDEGGMAMAEKAKGNGKKPGKAKAKKPGKAPSKAKAPKAKAAKKPAPERAKATFVGEDRPNIKKGDAVSVLGVYFHVQDAKGRKCYLASKYLKVRGE